MSALEWHLARCDAQRDLFAWQSREAFLAGRDQPSRRETELELTGWDAGDETTMTPHAATEDEP